MREHHIRELLLMSLCKNVHIHGALAILVTMYGACLGAEKHDISLCLFNIPVRSIFFGYWPVGGRLDGALWFSISVIFILHEINTFFPPCIINRLSDFLFRRLSEEPPIKWFCVCSGHFSIPTCFKSNLQNNSTPQTRYAGKYPHGKFKCFPQRHKSSYRRALADPRSVLQCWLHNLKCPCEDSIIISHITPSNWVGSIQTCAVT